MASCPPRGMLPVHDNYVSTVRSREPLRQVWKAAPSSNALFWASENRRVYGYGPTGMQWGGGDWRLDRTDNGAFYVKTQPMRSEILWIRLATHKNHWHAPYDVFVDMDTGACEISYNNGEAERKSKAAKIAGVSDTYWVTFAEGVLTLGFGATPGANALVQLDNRERHLGGYVDWGVGRLSKGGARNHPMPIDAVPLKRAYV